MLDLTQYIIVRLEDDNSVENVALLRMTRLDCIMLPTHRLNYKEHRQHMLNTFRGFVSWLVSSQIAEHVVPEQYYYFE